MPFLFLKVAFLRFCGYCLLGYRAAFFAPIGGYLCSCPVVIFARARSLSLRCLAVIFAVYYYSCSVCGDVEGDGTHTGEDQRLR